MQNKRDFEKTAESTTSITAELTKKHNSGDTDLAISDILNKLLEETKSNDVQTKKNIGIMINELAALQIVNQTNVNNLVHCIKIKEYQYDLNSIVAVLALLDSKSIKKTEYTVSGLLSTAGYSRMILDAITNLSSLPHLFTIERINWVISFNSASRIFVEAILELDPQKLFTYETEALIISNLQRRTNASHETDQIEYLPIFFVETLLQAQKAGLLTDGILAKIRTNYIYCRNINYGIDVLIAANIFNADNFTTILNAGLDAGKKAQEIADASKEEKTTLDDHPAMVVHYLV